VKPVYISGEVTLSPNDVKSPDNSGLSLRNPFLAPMWIDRINFSFDDDYAGIVYTDLKLGTVPLTDGFVPTDLLCEPQEFSNQVGLRRVAWVLSRPLFLLPGEFLYPRFFHSAQGGTDPLAAHITYIGRSLEGGDPMPSPGKTFMPYVSSWVAPSHVGGAAYTDKSSESNLRNPFPDPLEVVCMRGRISKGSTLTTGSAVFQNTLVRAVNQDNSIVAKDNSEFFTLFGDGFWRTRFALPANGFVVVSLTENWSTLNPANTYWPRFSMIGYRTR